MKPPGRPFGLGGGGTGLRDLKAGGSAWGRNIREEVLAAGRAVIYFRIDMSRRASRLSELRTEEKNKKSFLVLCSVPHKHGNIR